MHHGYCSGPVQSLVASISFTCCLQISTSFYDWILFRTTVLFFPSFPFFFPFKDSFIYLKVSVIQLEGEIESMRECQRGREEDLLPACSLPRE